MLKYSLSIALLASGACFAGSTIPLNQIYDDYSAQNSGKTGLIEMPNARVMDDWRARPHMYYSDPFIYYGLTVSPLPRTEINFRMTQLSDVAVDGGSVAWSGYGDYKDKAIDLKFLLLKEDNFWPAVAIGFDDIQGTGLYSSKYLVGTKRFEFLDLTAGYALGRMGGEDLRIYGANGADDRGITFLTSTMLGGGSLFGGVEAHLTSDLSLKAEYSPINYQYDYVNPFLLGQSPMPSGHINAGLKYKLTDKLTFSANFERGNVYGVGLNFTIPFRDQGLYDHAPEPKWRASDAKKEQFLNLSDQDLSKEIANDIAAEKFSNVQVAVNENKIWASIENPKYNSNLEALGRTADVIDEVAPQKINELYLALKQSNLEYSVLHVYRDDVKKIKQDENLPLSEKMFDFSDDVDESFEAFSGGKELFMSDPISGKKFLWIFKPSLQTYLNDKENPFTYKFSLLGGARYETSPGGFIYGRLLLPIVNTTDTITPIVLEPADTATRTDSLLYNQYNGVQLHDLVYDQIFKLPWKFFGRTEVGFFEPAYAGIDVELYRPLSGGRYGIGAEYQYAKKRKVEEMFGFENTSFEGKFINLYANIVPELGIKTSAKIGQFFAGDKGVSLTVMREFKNFTMGAFVTKTDTSVFQSPDNRGYMDKGVFLTIPISTVSPEYVKGSLNYSIKPWTRDVGQYAGQINTLIGLDPANVTDMRSDLNNFRE